MIVVVGSPIARPEASGLAASGLAAAVARAAAMAGAAVQVVGRVGEDAAGDAVLLDLAAAGVGHVAVLREAGRQTPTAPPRANATASPDGPELGEMLIGDGDGEAADEDGASAAAVDDDEPAEPDGLSVDAGDLQLALRYVPDYRVLVLAADLPPDALAAVVAGAAWSGAHLIALVGDVSAPPGLPDAATVLARPASDPDGAFARIVAAYAVALDGGATPDAAFAAAQRAGGWAAVAD